MSYFVATVYRLDKEGSARWKYTQRQFERRYQAITFADQYDPIINPLTGKREYGTAIVEHRS